MKFFFYAVYIHMKRILISGYFAVCAIIILLLFAAGAYLSKSQDELVIKLGIIYNADSEIETSIYKIMSEYSNLDVTVYQTTYEAQRAVASGGIASAYIFDNVEQKLADKDFTNFATALHPPYTSAGGIVNQLVYSAILKAVAPQISYDYLQLNSDSSLSYNDIQTIIDRYFKDGIFVKAEEVLTDSGSTVQAESSQIKFLDGRHIIHGIIALVIFLFFLLISARQISDKYANIYFRMTHATKIINEAAYSTALYLTGVLFIFVGIVFVKIMFPDFAYPLSKELPSALSFIFCLTAINMLLSSVLPRVEHIHTNAAIIFIFVCIFGNIFFDISILSGRLGAVQRIFPTSYYISSLKSGTYGVFALLISGLVIHAVCLLGKAAKHD